MVCRHCGKELEQKEGKKERLYCGDACRMAHKRTKGKSEQPKSEQIKNEQPNPNRRDNLQATEVQYIVERAKTIPGFGGPNCECMHCRAIKSNGLNLTINHGPYKPAGELVENEVNRVAMPGDPDYIGVGVVDEAA